MANRAAVAAAAQGLDEYQLQQLRHSLPLFHSQMLPIGMNGGNLANTLSANNTLNLIPNLGNGIMNGRKRDHDEDLKPEIYTKVQRGMD